MKKNFFTSVEEFKSILQHYKPMLNIRLQYADCEQYGKMIRKLRIGQNLSQEELGKKLNISKQAVNHIEHGGRKNINPFLFTELYNFFGCTADYLLGYTDVPERNLSVLEQFLIENPNSAYNNAETIQALKETYPDMPELQRLITPFYFISDDIHELKEKLLEETKDDLDALRLCIQFLELSDYKRSHVKEILKKIFQLIK